MHGSSSVPKDEVDRINAAGGKMSDTVGVDPNEYLPAAKLGVTKVNIDTDGRLVWTRVHREFFRDKPGEFDFRPPGKIFMKEYANFIASRNKYLGSAGASFPTCARHSELLSRAQPAGSAAYGSQGKRRASGFRFCLCAEWNSFASSLI